MKESAPEVPHFHAKKVTEDMIKAAGLPFVLVRAPAFLDQNADCVADGVRAGRFYVVGDKATRWSCVLTDDLAANLAQAATRPGEYIVNQTIATAHRCRPVLAGASDRSTQQLDASVVFDS
jgi:uncharacterized protein YbjT (DUF2867 family)